MRYGNSEKNWDNRYHCLGEGMRTGAMISLENSKEQGTCALEPL